ncbi:enoyl-CoA hydratase-related protein [Methylocaldum gracile]|jgi:polyketide biosynthesis enoyl-CoA hydratase PksH|uniref:enoyl-CoA hydratase-related protein n=1 Tax=unclassified Methylocaldum TaxID=2622260 RepID=UPI0010608D42
MIESEVLVKRASKLWTVTINRLEKRNSINDGLLNSLNHVLDEAERDDDCKIVVIEGRDRIFCTGMDFDALSKGSHCGDFSGTDEAKYMNLLVRFASIPKIIVTKVEGLALAGGVGFVAASDLVISNRHSQFGLSEALWGLLPACVAPFLIRRVGFQKAYKMTMTTEMIEAEEAWRIGLVDILTDNPGDEIRRQLLRMGRLEVQTIRDLKRYFREMWLIDERIEHVAVSEISRLIKTPRVLQNIRNYLEFNKFPWET